MKHLPRSVRMLLAVIVGAAGGYLWYATVGCATGTCPISSNPWISTAYGALVGFVASWGSSKPARTKSDAINR